MIPVIGNWPRQANNNLKPYSATEDNRRYTLKVEQQPQRARMCGFGDKDRRPITPPPCVELLIQDIKTHEHINPNEIEPTMFVVNVDLWSEDGLREVNLVRHTTASPSISSTTNIGYSAHEPATPVSVHPSSRDGGSTYGSQPPYMAPYQHQGAFASPNSFNNFTAFYPPTDAYGHAYNYPRPSISSSTPGGMYTRNLIGSLTASAFRLVDRSDRIGIWFIMQDLSVRTEGFFRLRFSFVNLGTANGQLQTGKAKVLATSFSDVFQVYSAKKFPGVCESTALSKCFAAQGIKIPIRKEGTGAKGVDDDHDDGY